MLYITEEFKIPYLTCHDITNVPNNIPSLQNLSYIFSKYTGVKKLFILDQGARESGNTLYNIIFVLRHIDKKKKDDLLNYFTLFSYLTNLSRSNDGELLYFSPKREILVFKAINVSQDIINMLSKNGSKRLE